jgi:very-short-patch-repair endonuclease
VQVKKGTENWRSSFNRISSKHIEFLLCSADTLDPVLVVELDDSSHSTANRRAANAFRNNVFQAAGLPLLRIPARAAYNPREIATQVHGILSGEIADTNRRGVRVLD